MRDAEARGGASGAATRDADAPRLPSEAREDLRAVARLALEHGVRQGRPPRIDLVALAPALQEPGACFVTLERRGALRGCLGTLEAEEPLGLAVARHAVKAAADPRLAPVAPAELPELHVKVSVLSPLERLDVRDEAGLLAQVRPGLHGLLVREGPWGATFLPAVWAQLPSPTAFLRALERKAGLPSAWGPERSWWRYTALEIDAPPPAARAATERSARPIG